MSPISVDFSPLFPGTTLRYLSGVRDTKCSLDTLKKEYGKVASSKKEGKRGFWQVFPQSAVHGPTHLAWATFSTLSSAHAKSLHFRQPELELLARVAGTFQWSDAKSRAGLKDTDKNIVLVWVGPAAALTSAQFSSVATKWGLKPGAWKFEKEESPVAIERSALAALE